jgi:hypothetical protein
MTGYESKKAMARDKLLELAQEGMSMHSHDAPEYIVCEALIEALAQTEQEPVCPECKAGVLYECVACSSNNYPPKPAQEPVAWLCTPDEDGLFGLPLADKGCKDCFPVYTTPPQEKNSA